MKRMWPATMLALLFALAAGGCGGAYTTPSRGIATDIEASHATGSGSIDRSNNLNFRDNDLQSAH